MNRAHKLHSNASALTQVTKFKAYTPNQIEQIAQLKQLPAEMLREMRVVSQVLPFRVNSYVIDELIDWNNIPDDPIFQLTFPQREMLSPRHFKKIADLLDNGADPEEMRKTAHKIRLKLNPHPARQQQLNIPTLSGETLEGVQHKYRETVLFFPGLGQTCHSYCTFCFRWAQFVGDKNLRIAANEASHLHSYLQQEHQVTDLLLTGGDPMVIKTQFLERYLEPLMAPEFDHLQNIRIGTKALSYWPHRFVLDDDADDLLRLLERLVKSGKHVALMAHLNHGRELETPIVREAIRRIRDTGANIRAQSPLIAHINDSSDVWTQLWREEVRLGLIPYYMFVARNTGSKRYFEVPLARTWEIYRDAIQQVSGLARTVRGPSMSAGPGKVEIQGVSEINGEKVFVLRFIQGRNPEWVQRPFFAAFDEKATWLDELRPAFGEEKFFYQEEYDAMQQMEENDAD